MVQVQDTSRILEEVRWTRKAVAVAGSGLGRDRGKEKTSLWPHALELSGFLFPQWASVTQRSVWISFPALRVDPGLPRVVLV